MFWQPVSIATVLHSLEGGGVDGCTHKEAHDSLFPDMSTMCRTVHQRVDLRAFESEERRDDVSEGVAYEGHERTDHHEGRSQHVQDGASNPNAGEASDHHDSDHQYNDARLRAVEKKLDSGFISLSMVLYIIIIIKEICESLSIGTYIEGRSGWRAHRPL